MANVARYLTGFEGWPLAVPSITGGGLATGVTGTPTITTGSARSGTRGLQINPVAAADESIDLVVFTGQAVSATSFYVKPVTLDTSTPYAICQVGLTAGASFRIGVNTSNQWILFTSVGGATVPIATGPSLALGQWTLIELLVDASVNPTSMRWRIGGVEQTPPSTTAQAATTFRRISFGAFSTGNRTVEFHFDDLMVIDGTDQSMWPTGGFLIEGITADQAAAAAHQGTLTGWVYTDNNFGATTAISTTTETASRSRVNVLGDANKGVANTSATPAGNLRYPIADPANTGTPRAVALITASKESATGVDNATFRTLLSASTTTHFTGDPGWGTTLTYLYTCMDTKPTSGAWTLADVQGINFEFASTDGSPNPQLMGFQYEVAFPDVAPPTNTIVNPNAALQRATNW